MGTHSSIDQSIITKMLQRLDNKTVCGSNFEVHIPNIHWGEYTEGEMIARVEIEGGVGPDGEINWLIYAETLRGWERPHESSEMSKAKRKEILSNISLSFDLLSMPHEIVK